jgi:sodium-coupled neutral amino acid transporter 11
MFLTAYGSMIAYMIIIGDTIPRIGASFAGEDSFLADRELVIFLFAFFVILPLSVLRDMASLSWSSSISIAADVAIVFIMLFHAPVVARRQGIELNVSELDFARPTLFAGVGAMSFAFVCHHSSFIVFSSLANANSERWGRVTHWSVGFAGTACMILATTGYLSFLDETEGDVLNNFPDNDPVASAGRALLALTMFFTYPMEHFVARHVLHCCIARYRGQAETEMTNRWRYALTALLWSSTLVIGMSTKNLGAVLEVTGAVAGSTLAYILPAAIYLVISKHEVNEAAAAWRKSSPGYRPALADRLKAVQPFALPFLLIVGGVIALVAGVATILST